MEMRTEAAAGRRLETAAAVVLAVIASLSLAPQRAAAAIEPTTIGRLTVVEDAPGEQVLIEADGTLVWTQYRDSRGDLVVDLPNTVIAAGVEGLVSEGLVSRLDVEAFDGPERPLTRFIIRTARATEHSLNLDGNSLSLTFTPIRPELLGVAETSPFALAANTTPAPTIGGGFLQEPSPAQTGRGTPEEPVPGPLPVGVSATRLEGVEVIDLGGDPGLRIRGDGEFSYRTFVLQEPLRFVIDLIGVVNTAAATTVSVDSQYVDQVRMAQFRPYPEPVSRVVLDLRESRLPIIESGSDGLVLRFSAVQVAEAPVATPTASIEEPIEESIEETTPAAEVAEILDEANRATASASPAGTAPEPEVEPEVEPTPLREALSPAPSSVPSAGESASPGRLVVESASEPAPGASPSRPSSAALEPEEPAAPALAIATAQPPPEAAPPPLEIRDDRAGETPRAPRPPRSDVALYEPREPVVEVRSQGPRAETISGPAFGVQSISPETRWIGEPISMTLKDAEVTEVLRSIARLADLNIVIQPGVTGPVTVELDRVPWDQALEQILKVNNLGKQLEGNILRVAPIAQLEQEARQQQMLEQAKALSVPLTTIMRRISYADASDVARILTRGQRTQSSGGQALSLGQSGILSQRGSISVDQRTNTLIIRELPAYLGAVIQIIDNLDIPEKQVMIEARIVETTRNFSRSLGVNWSVNGIADAAHGNTSGLVFPNNANLNGGANLLTGGNNGFLSLGLGNVLDTFTLDMTLNAAESQGLVNVISAPKVAVLNNERAEIQTGLQIPVQTVANNTVTVQFVNATLRLEVTPHVTAEGTIMMQIDIQKREPQLAFAIVGATNAPIATREAHTRVIVRDGGTAVIGGIYEVTSNDGSDKVPGLANIPIIGHLFKNRNRSNQNEELLIFITPRVVQL